MICNKCKKPIPQDSIFCIHCGVALSQQLAAEPVQPTVSQPVTLAESFTQPPQTAEDVAPTTETPQPVDSPVPTEQIAQPTISQPAPTVCENTKITQTATPQPATKGKKLSFKGKISPKMLTACALAVFFALLNVVQLISTSNLREDNQLLQAKTEQLEATVQDYSQKLSQALEISPEEREIRDKAKRYDTLTTFVMEQSQQNNSKKYYPSTYLVVMELDGGQQKFEITADFDEATVYFDVDGDAVDGKFAQNWRGANIDVILTPNYKGTSKLTFTNDVTKDEFTVLVVVI